MKTQWSVWTSRTCSANMKHGCIQNVKSNLWYWISNFWGAWIKHREWGKEGKEGERDRKDREKNRLTSLHLIGSSCNHKETQTTDDRKQSETGKKDTGQRDTERHRENTATKVSSQRWLAQCKSRHTSSKRPALVRKKYDLSAVY